MKILYILFIAVINALICITLYLKVNKDRKISPVLWWFWAATIIVISCHAEFFKMPFLLPLNDLLEILLWSLGAAIAHLIYEFYFERIQESNWLRPRMMSFVNIITPVLQVFFYILITIVQSVMLVAIIERYYA